MENKNSEQFKKYRDNIISILNTPLTPQNFTNYASDALSAVIMAVHDIYASMDEYKGRGYDKTIEDEILNMLGFSSDLIIETLALKIEQITQVTKVASTVMGAENKNNSNHKLEVVLYILNSEFGIDFNDQNQFELAKGYVLPNQKRTEPYYIVTAPVVNATILVCNDDISDTFVFDNKKLRENKIFSDKMNQLSSSEDDTRELIDSIDGIGIAIPAKAKFASNIMPAIKSTIYENLKDFNTPKYDKTSDVALLRNKAILNMPAGYVFLYDFANTLSLSQTALNSLINSIADKLGEIKLYKLYIGRVEPCLSIEQQTILKSLYDSFPSVPSGYMSVAGFIDTIGIDESMFHKLVNSYSGLFGPVVKYRLRSGGIDDCLNPKQQEIVRNAYNQFPAIPAGYIALSALSKSLGKDIVGIKKIIKDIGDDFGEVKSYRLPIGRIEECISSEQLKFLNDNHTEASSLPTGYIALSAFARNMGISQDALSEIVIASANELGPINKYELTMGRVESCLSPEQQQIIRTSYDKYPSMPEGYQSVSIFAASGSHDKSVVDRMIEALGDHIGEIKQYRTLTGKIESCLNPDQQHILNDLLKL